MIGLPANLEDDPELLALEVGADEVRVDPADDNALQVRGCLSQFSTDSIRFAGIKGVQTENQGPVR